MKFRGPEGKKGIIFINTLIISALMVVIAVAATNMILQDSYMIRRLKNSQKAQYLAEAGINAALAGLADDFNLGIFPVSGTIGADTYNVTYAESGGRVLLTSTGTVTMGSGTSDDIVRRVSAEIKDLTPSSMYYIMSSGTDLRIRAGFVTLTDINGKVHGNNSVWLRTGLLLGFMDISDTATYTTDTVYIDTYLGTITVDGVHFGIGTHTTRDGWNAIAVTLPEFDYNYYRQLAIDSGDYYSGNRTFDGATLTPGNGIVYVEGKATIKGNTHVYGGLVAEEIEIATERWWIFVTKKGEFYQHESGDKNAIVSRLGNISVDGELHTEKALVYAENDISSLAIGSVIDVTGVICSGRNINLWEFIAYITYNHSKPAVKFGPDVNLVKIISWND